MTTTDTIKKSAYDFADAVVAMAPPQITNLFWQIARHPGTPWFFLGTGVEALGITVQYMFFDASFPILDFIVGFAIFAYLAYWQHNNQDGGDDTDAEGDSEEEDGDEEED